MLFEDLRKEFKYNPATGELIRVRTGQAVGFLNGKGKKARLQVSFKNKKWLVHRLIWAIHHGKWPDGIVDHINRDPFDNRISNLRDTNYRVNRLNMSAEDSARPPGRTGHKGIVATPRGDFIVKAYRHGVQHYLGRAKTISDALSLRDRAA